MRRFEKTLALNPGTLMGYNPLKSGEISLHAICACGQVLKSIAAARARHNFSLEIACGRRHGHARDHAPIKIACHSADNGAVSALFRLQ